MVMPWPVDGDVLQVQGLAFVRGDAVDEGSQSYRPVAVQRGPEIEIQAAEATMLGARDGDADAIPSWVENPLGIQRRDWNARWHLAPSVTPWIIVGDTAAFRRCPEVVSVATDEEPEDNRITEGLVEERTRRTDRATRLLIDGLVANTSEISKLKVSTVNWRLLTPVLGAAAMAIITFSSRNTASTVRDAVERGDRHAAEQLRAIREEMAELKRAAAYSKGTFDVVGEKRPAAAVVKEVREATADGGTR